MSEATKPTPVPREKKEPTTERQSTAPASETRDSTGPQAFATDSARALGEVTRRVMEQGRVAWEQGIGTMSSAQAPVAESSYMQGRRFIETAVQLTDCYREATERTSENMQMLNACSIQLLRGVQQLQHAWFDTLQSSLERLGRKPQNLFSCRSPLEMAQLQRDIYSELIGSMVSTTTTLLQTTAEISQEALRTLHPQSPRRG